MPITISVETVLDTKETLALHKFLGKMSVGEHAEFKMNEDEIQCLSYLWNEINEALRQLPIERT